MTKSWQHLGLAVILSLGGAIATATRILAQSITIDGTLSPAQTLTGPSYTIPQSAGQTVGSNLFQSFGRFNLNMGETANFESAGNIRNILSRVTGGSASMINGLIFTNSNVNLFLINPSGIVFGPNASLNVGGSFVASTANALQFGNLGFFSATDKNIPSPLLTINPSALLFNQINQNAAIQNNSVAPAIDPAGFNANGLRVPDGKSLLLVGGNVSMDGGQLNAYGGRVELGGLTEPGSVALSVDGDNLSLKFPEKVQRADVSLTNGASVSVASSGGGSIAVNARNIDILSGSRLLAGIGSGLGSVDSQAGDITLNVTGAIRLDATGAIMIQNNRLKNNIDPSAGFINLPPTNVVNTPSLVSQSCSAFGKGGSQFTVTGRGGLPPSPDDPLTSDVVWSDTRLTVFAVSPSRRVTPSVRKTTEGVAIVPATGWVFDKKTGNVTLIASNASSEGVGSNQVNCIVP